MNPIGAIGEEFVSHWLAQQQWQILHHSWRCRWGEIDLIAESPQKEIAFIEVKTRGRGNWDSDGLLAVNFAKQVKIQKTAAFFLQQYPQFCDRNCRFDVALVGYQALSETLTGANLPQIERQKPVLWQNYLLVLIDYLENAFTL